MSSMQTSIRLIAMTGLTNLVFWLLWPGSIVRVADLGWGAAATGVFASAAPFTMAMSLPLASRLVATIGHRNSNLIAIAILTLSSGAPAIADHPPLEWIWTIGLGTGTGLRWIATDSWIADTVPAQQSGRILAIGESVVGLGFAVGPAAASLAGGELLLLSTGAVILCLCGAALIFPVAEPSSRSHSNGNDADGPRFSGMQAGAAILLLFAALLGGTNETGFAGIAPLLAIAAGGSQPLYAAAAVGLGSFVAQYALGAAADRWGGCKVLMICAASLGMALLAIAWMPQTLPLMSFIIGAAGGGLYTVAIVFGLQARRTPTSSVPLISAAAFAYSVGALAAPAAIGVGIDLAGPALTLTGMALLSIVLLIAVLALRGWRWTDRNLTHDAVCAFRVSPQSADRLLTAKRDAAS
jgi:MFS family permease